MVSLLPQDSGSLADQLLCVTSINVLDYSNLPHHICPECQDQLTKSYNFKLRSQQSDCTLKSLIQSNVVKNESEEINLLEPLGSSFDDNVECFSESVVLDVTYEPENDSEQIVQKKRNSIKKNTEKSVQDSKSDIKIKKAVKTCICTECFQSFPNMKSLQVHKQINHSDEKSIKCNKCKDTFLSEKDYQMHLVLHSKTKNFTCPECKKDFKTRSQLKRHLRRHMEVKQHECDVCKKRFSEQYALQRHYRVHTGEALEKKHKCEVCDKRFSSTSSLMAHAHTHSGARPYVCACGAAFPSRRLLRSHAAVHEPHLPHQCPECQRRFRHLSTLTAHLRTHSGERPYVCAACGRRFLQSSNLTQHMRTHSGEKPYTCSVCQRSFSSSSSLRSHARTHTGEKPYGCPVCGKRFARCDMTSHMRRHSGARPHACPACPRRFYTAARLREHTNVMHSGEKPFECAMCEEKFATKSHLVKHIKSHDKKSKRKRQINKNILLVTNETPYTVQLLTENLLINDKSNVAEEVVISQQEDISNSDVAVTLGNMEVEQMPEECQANEAIIVDGLQNNCQETYCVSENGIIETLDLSNVNLVTVNGGEISIDATQGVLEEGTVKLYQVDQSLLQISTCNGQVTISKITSKMTANFE
ncbi:unnamed protein product [Plutella xylostella]|uniref:(diamondback moth) hypothetical protein n=1 Tax=Plutella xylostella TaxID=51655 RepID=A0A8S4EDL4_PLUXY|nr:unnamed protein product [Plutella xylostella]